MEQTYTLTVNGEPHTVTSEPDRPLLDVLRHDLGLVGSRFGCGVAMCGACFVLVDGAREDPSASRTHRPVPSCDTPMWSVDRASVTTVEGLGRVEGLDGDGGTRGRVALHRVQQAFLDEQAGQCAYCVSGILVSAAALLAENPHPDEQAVAAALDRNLCRCGVHPRVVRAVARAGESARAAAPVEEGQP